MKIHDNKNGYATQLRVFPVYDGYGFTYTHSRLWKKWTAPRGGWISDLHLGVRHDGPYQIFQSRPT